MGEFADLPVATLYAAAILAVLNIPCYVLVGKAVFGSWDEFVDAVRFWLTPDLLSAIRGDWADDFWAEMKLWVWFFACTGLVLLEVFLIHPFLPA